MDDRLNRDLHQAVLTRTLVMSEPPRAVKDRLDVLRKALARRPLPGDAGPTLIVHAAGADTALPLAAPEVTIGTDPASVIRLDAEYVSRRHCRLCGAGPDWLLEDLGSTNGTYVNGTRVTRRPLRDGDIVQVGAATLLFFRGGATPV